MSDWNEKGELAPMNNWRKGRTHMTFYVKNLKTQKSIVFRDDNTIGCLERISAVIQKEPYAKFIDTNTFIVGDLGAEKYSENDDDGKPVDDNTGKVPVDSKEVFSDLSQLLNKYVYSEVDREILTSKCQDLDN